MITYKLCELQGGFGDSAGDQSSNMFIKSGLVSDGAWPLVTVGLYELQGGFGDSAGDQSYDVSVKSRLVSDGAWPLTTDVRVGHNRVVQVFITHSAHVFMVDYPPVVSATGREVPGEHLLRLEDQVCLLLYYFMYYEHVNSLNSEINTENTINKKVKVK